jgi:hypothetical protein
MTALDHLLVEVNAASEVLYGRGLRDTPGRTTSGYHGDIAAGKIVPSHRLYPGEPDEFSKKGGGRRRQRGGAACDDNQWVKLAVDSAIILAGAGAVIGATYTGFSVLNYYMSIFNVGPSVIAIVTALYDLCKTIITSTIPGLTSVATDLALAAGRAAVDVAPSLIKTIAPFVPVYLYMNGRNAIGDAAGICRNIYRDSSEAIEGVVTRSMARKAEFERAIAAKSAQTQAALTHFKDSTIQGGFATAHRVTRLSDKVCALIDKVAASVAAGATHTVNIADEIAAMLDVEPIGPGQGGKYRKRTMHRSKKRRASRKRMSRRY